MVRSNIPHGAGRAGTRNRPTWPGGAGGAVADGAPEGRPCGGRPVLGLAAPGVLGESAREGPARGRSGRTGGQRGRRRVHGGSRVHGAPATLGRGASHLGHPRAMRAGLHYVRHAAVGRARHRRPAGPRPGARRAHGRAATRAARTARGVAPSSRSIRSRCGAPRRHVDGPVIQEWPRTRPDARNRATDVSGESIRLAGAAGSAHCAAATVSHRDATPTTQSSAGPRGVKLGGRPSHAAPCALARGSCQRRAACVGHTRRIVQGHPTDRPMYGM
jgi:hypothetical protein